MSQITVLSLSEVQQWQNKLNKLPVSQQDVYFTPVYYSLYENYGDGKARCFIYEDNQQIVIYPFLVNTINDLGYELKDKFYDIQGAYGYNGLITSSSEATFITDFHNKFDEYCRDNNIIAEFTRFHPLLSNVEFASPQMSKILSRKTVKLDLRQDLNDIWMTQFSTKNRNVIRKAEKEGVIIEENDDYETFRQLYNKTMENVSAEDYYFFPESYFEEYKKTFRSHGILCFAKLNGKPIAGSMFMFSGDYAHYHLSARDSEYYKIAANNLILWYGIRRAKERGCKWFHFGGGTTGNDDDRLLHFKRNFSKELGDFWIGKRVHNQQVYDMVVEQWKNKYPDKWEDNKMKLLGYREI